MPATQGGVVSPVPQQVACQGSHAAANQSLCSERTCRSSTRTRTGKCSLAQRRSLYNVSPRSHQTQSWTVETKALLSKLDCCKDNP
eukprot:2385177-Amphidinium_carterae.1